MAVIQGFTRPSDPIEVSQIESDISAALGLPVTAVVTATDVIVTGAVTEANRTAIQTVLDNYFYRHVSTGVGLTDDPNMGANRHNMAISEHAAYQTDTAIYNATRNVGYIAGVKVYDAIPYSNDSATDANGNAVFYLTDDATSTGVTLYTTVFEKTITPVPYGNASNYQVASWTVSGDKRTLTVKVNQLGSVLAGLVSVTGAAAGVKVNLTLIGK